MDAPAFAALLLTNRARIQTSFPDRVQAVLTPAAALATVEGFMQDWRTGRFYVLGIWHRQTSEYLGDICLLPRPPVSGEIGYYLAAEAEGQGYAREALEAMTSFGFQRLGLPSLAVRCFADNKRGQAVARAIGFQEEATPKKSFWFGSPHTPANIVRFTLFRSK
jgi:RimJ/RimL family protein N-acetyltransferase